ncbi:MAG TPA: ATPase domain-containing protein [Methanotrichaceae archaeon]|nr:ATPase domain-containing protein [Methanotrichaceae archaeon]
MVLGMQNCRNSRRSAFDRIPTGVHGLDEMIGGGLPVPSMILVSGGLGTGRTTLCTQFLCQGASQRERGLYFMIFKGTPEWAMRFAGTYEFAKESYFPGLIRYLDLGDALEEVEDSEEVLGIIRSELAAFRPRRIVIDAPAVLEDVLKDEYRRFLLNLAKVIKEQSRVALIIGEPSLSMPYPAEIAYICDGIIILRNSEAKLSRRRSLEVLKMRGTSHASGKIAIDISSQGLAIYPGL